MNTRQNQAVQRAVLNCTASKQRDFNEVVAKRVSPRYKFHSTHSPISRATSTMPHAASPTKTALPKKAITGFLTTRMVNDGEVYKNIFKIICHAKTPIAKPTTLITLNNGTYPAKSSSPKIKGTINEKPKSAAKLRGLSKVARV